MSQNKIPYRPSPAGVVRYVWINKPDTAFNEAGIFKCELSPTNDEEAAKFKADLDKAAEEAFAELLKDLPEKDRKKWSVYVPYKNDEDEQGNPTGKIWVSFRQNATLLVEGEPKKIQIAIFDAEDKKVSVPIFPGSVLRVMYRPRPIKVASSKQAGVRLDFLKVQVVKLAERDQTGGFGEVEGGYVKDPADDADESFDRGGNATGDF